MKTRRTTILFGVFLSVMLLAGMAAGITVQAAGGGANPVLRGAPSVPSTPASSSSSAQPAGDIVVEGYDVYVDGNLATTTNILSPGQEVMIRVSISDSRIQTATTLQPAAYLNTLSFVSSSVLMQSLPPHHAYLGNGANAAGDARIFRPDSGAISAPGNNAPVHYELVFPVRYTGMGKSFAFDLRYQESVGVPMYSFKIELNQSIEVPSSSAPTSDTASTSVRGTGFVMKSASYGTGNIRAGGTFKLNVVLLSTNGTGNVENVYVSISPSKEIALAGGNSVVYIGTVAPNQEVPVSFDLQAGNVDSEGTYKITIDVKGVDVTGTAVAATMDIAIPITFSERFEIFNVQVPDFLTVGGMDGSGYTSITLVNKGKGAIHNVSAEVVGEGLSSQEGNQFIGNIAAGTQSSVDFTLVAEQPGDLSGQILIHYEDAMGNEKTLKYDFSVTAEQMQDMPSPFPMEPEVPAQTGMPVWGWLLIGLGVAAAVAVTVIIIVKRRKAKRDAELLDEYEDSGDETV